MSGFGIDQGKTQCVRLDAGQQWCDGGAVGIACEQTHFGEIRQPGRALIGWLFRQQASEAEPFAPPALDHLPRKRVLCGPFDVATSAPRVVENFLDLAREWNAATGRNGAGATRGAVWSN